MYTEDLLIGQNIEEALKGFTKKGEKRKLSLEDLVYSDCEADNNYKAICFPGTEEVVDKPIKKKGFALLAELTKKKLKEMVVIPADVRLQIKMLRQPANIRKHDEMVRLLPYFRDSIYFK